MQKYILKSVLEYLHEQKQPRQFWLKYISSSTYIHNTNGTTQQIENYYLWTNLISDLAQRSTNTRRALLKVFQNLNYGNKPNGYALFHLVRALTDMNLDSCQQLHSYILRSGFCSNVHVATALIGFYFKIGSLTDAHKMFVDIPQPNIVSWNSMVSGCVHSGQFREALNFFLELDRSEVSPDSYSLTAGLSACSQLSLLQLGKSIHSKIVKLGLESSIFPSNCLIDMYGKCGSVEEATSVFHKITDKDVVSWNSIISASGRNGSLKLAASFFQQMPNPDTISYNELINAFAQFGDMGEAIEILSKMPTPNSSSWNAIITGYVNRNRAREALVLFSKMHVKNIEMDQFTFSSILSGVAGLSALTWGILIHCCTIKGGLNTSTVVVSALIDMYSKCGQVESAESIFQSLPEKNLVTWNSMITGFARYGNSSKVIQLFEQLQIDRDIKPDEITFLNILSACSHDKMPLEVANRYFEMMIQFYRIEPTVEHCCSMIRLMGERGEVLKGVRMIYELGFGACELVWRALLGACETCKDLTAAKIVAAKVIELEGDNGYVYVVFSNIHAYYGKWEDVKAIRKMMKDKGMKKQAGYSWIEIDTAK